MARDAIRSSEVLIAPTCPEAYNYYTDVLADLHSQVEEPDVIDLGVAVDSLAKVHAYNVELRSRLRQALDELVGQFNDMDKERESALDQVADLEAQLKEAKAEIQSQQDELRGMQNTIDDMARSLIFD